MGEKPSLVTDDYGVYSVVALAGHTVMCHTPVLSGTESEW